MRCFIQADLSTWVQRESNCASMSKNLLSTCAGITREGKRGDTPYVGKRMGLGTKGRRVNSGGVMTGVPVNGYAYALGGGHMSMSVWVSL